MILALLAFLGGTLTIISPCTLPVLPFVFAKTDRPFVRSTLPLLLGMAVTFAAVATLAAVGGGWAVRLNSVGRVLALALLALFGVALLSKRVAEWLARPAIALGNRLLQSGPGSGAADAAQSVLLGVATGLLWAPCAGPILGLILTGAAIRGPNASTTLLLLAYALGAAASIALVTLAGRGVYGALRRSTRSPGAADTLRVLLDGRAPGQNHGADTDAQGYGVVHEQRLYQLIRQSGEVGSHTFSIEFLVPDVHAYSFTFG